jgi:hypothetical protein
MSMNMTMTTSASMTMSGKASPNKLLSNGYEVALAARSLPDKESKEDNIYTSKADFPRPEAVNELFYKVERHLGIPCVIVYNGQSKVECLPQPRESINANNTKICSPELPRSLPPIFHFPFP